MTRFMLLLPLLAACAAPDDPRMTSIGDNPVELEAMAEAKARPRPPRLGHLLVTQDAMRPGEDIVVGGTSGQTVDVLGLQAFGEPLLLTDFTLLNVGDDETIATVEVGYYDSDGNPVVSISYPVAGEISFFGEDVLVPMVAGLARLVIYIDAAPDDVSTVPGMTGRLDWSDLNVEAVGLRSGRVYNASVVTDSVEGVTFEWHSTELTLSLAAWIPTDSGSGDAERFRFNASADAHNYSGYSALGFEISSTDSEDTEWNRCIGDGGDGVTNVDGDEVNGLTKSSLTVYDADDLTTPIDVDDDWILYESDGSECEDDDQVTYAMLDLDDVVEIAAGETEAYAVYVAATGASTDDALRMDLDYVNWQDQEYSFEPDLLESLPLTGPTIIFDGT